MPPGGGRRLPSAAGGESTHGAAAGNDRTPTASPSRELYWKPGGGRPGPDHHLDSQPASPAGGGCTGATSIIPPPFTGNYSEILTPTPRLTLINSSVLFAGRSRRRRRGDGSRDCRVAAPPVASGSQVGRVAAAAHGEGRTEAGGRAEGTAPGTPDSSKQWQRTAGRVAKKTQIEWREWRGGAR